jgi:hypothetical protein
MFGLVRRAYDLPTLIAECPVSADRTADGAPAIRIERDLVARDGDLAATAAFTAMEGGVGRIEFPIFRRSP